MKLKLLFMITLISISCSKNEKSGDQKAPQQSPSQDNNKDSLSAEADTAAQEASEETASSTPTPSKPTNCIDYAGEKNNPQSIKEFVDYLNDLPKPASLSCIVAKLKRPLLINATSGSRSAQPSNGPNSPRTFIKLGRLVISVVADGQSSKSIELGEILESNPDASIKGDIPVPVEVRLADTAPYDKISAYGEMLCGDVCHTGHTEVIEEYDNLSFAYASEIIKPGPSKDKPIEELKAIRDTCNAEDHSYCGLYKAIFDHGEVKAFSY